MDKIFIKYEEALQILTNHKAVLSNTSVAIDDAGGQFLAEDLIADRDFPPYHRVTMDGIAIRHQDFENGVKSLTIEQIAPAGAAQKVLKNENACVEVMTGAILPKNTDTVIKYEELEIQNTQATITAQNVKKKQNIHFKGMDVAKNTIIKKSGEQISSAEINIAASIGKDTITVKKLPKVAIISTGDELIEVHEKPLDHQVRKSNVHGIKNTFKDWGLSADLHHLPDDMDTMEFIIADLLVQYDLLVFTGGVSKGKFDFLPDVLTKVGVQKHFHKVQQRPGKPLWFGTKGEDAAVFGLPGNPVSSFVCLYAYVRFWLMQSLAIEERTTYVKLAEDITFKPALLFFMEAKLTSNPDGTLSALPVYGNGSGDFINLIKTDGFIMLPQDKSLFKKGEAYPFISYRNRL